MFPKGFWKCSVILSRGNSFKPSSHLFQVLPHCAQVDEKDVVEGPLNPTEGAQFLTCPLINTPLTMILIFWPGADENFSTREGESALRDMMSRNQILSRLSVVFKHRICHKKKTHLRAAGAFLAYCRVFNLFAVRGQHMMTCLRFLVI